MFSSLSPITHGVTLYLDGHPVTASRGESVAACLLRAGLAHNRRTPVSGAPRLPYCMIGNCFDCLVEIDGIGNQQACLTVVREGMQVRCQNGAATALETSVP
ncbi:(2Fe-2S)-binding protein [Komagataeibacter europaeus]|uniref:(2Fe-2S)-binding protein n=1 Tax=Komagataeibacter europaeus TaxID=33995 RepID=UPI000237DB41|nr:(2Fe-2S)-binding protein [Komagataeibacter europaeus]